MTDGIRTVTCSNCSAGNSGYLSTFHTLAFGVKHEAGCSPSYCTGYTTYQKKQFSGDETNGTLDNGGNQVA